MFDSLAHSYDFFISQGEGCRMSCARMCGSSLRRPALHHPYPPFALCPTEDDVDIRLQNLQYFIQWSAVLQGTAYAPAYLISEVREGAPGLWPASEHRHKARAPMHARMRRCPHTAVVPLSDALLSRIPSQWPRPFCTHTTPCMQVPTHHIPQSDALFTYTPETLDLKRSQSLFMLGGSTLMHLEVGCLAA